MAREPATGTRLMSTVRYNTAAGYAPARPLPTLTPAYVQVWTPKSTSPTCIVSLEASLWPYRTHYWEGRTRPCLALRKCCPACEKGLSGRLTAYLAGCIRTTKQRIVLQLTAGALAGCPELLELDGQLGARMLLVQRRHDGRQSPIDVRVVPGLDPRPIAAPIDTRKVLGGLWGYNVELVEALIAPDLRAELDPARPRPDNPLS